MDKVFKISERGSTVSREVIGGVTTFLAMPCILAVNPGILSASGKEVKKVRKFRRAGDFFSGFISYLCYLWSSVDKKKR